MSHHGALSSSLMQEPPSAVLTKPQACPSARLLSPPIQSNPPCRSPSDPSPSATFILSMAARRCISATLHLAADRGVEDRTIRGQHGRAYGPGNVAKGLSAGFVCLSLPRASILICKFLLASSHFRDSAHLGFAYTLLFLAPSLSRQHAVIRFRCHRTGNARFFCCFCFCFRFCRNR
jgi:hypothetical protein